MRYLPPNHDVGWVLASLHPQNVFLYLMECLSINLVVLVVVLLLDGKDFLVHEEDIFVHILSVPMEKMPRSCLLDHLQSRSKDVAL